MRTPKEIIKLRNKIAAIKKQIGKVQTIYEAAVTESTKESLEEKLDFLFWRLHSLEDDLSDFLF
jgi:predicted  nucleic acid-binding Zn-ribbon protein